MLATGSWIARRLERLEWLAERGHLPTELATLAADPEGRLLLLLPEARLAAARSLTSAEPEFVRLTRPAYLRLRRDTGGRGLNALLRSLPSGRARLQPWMDGRDPFRRGESLAHVVMYQPGNAGYGWWSMSTAVLVIAKGTPLRVMRTSPELELWPPEVPPIGHRWKKLECLVPDPEVVL